MKKQIVKKVLVLVMSAVMAVSFTACGGYGSNDDYLKKELLEAMKEANEEKKQTNTNRTEEDASRETETQVSDEATENSKPQSQETISQEDKQNLENLKNQVNGMMTLNAGLLSLIEKRYADETNLQATVTDIMNYVYEYLDEIEVTYQWTTSLSTNSGSEDFAATAKAAQDYFAQIYDTYYDLYCVGMTNFQVMESMSKGNSTENGKDVETQFNQKQTMVQELREIEYPVFLDLPMHQLVENYSNYLYAYQEYYKGYKLNDPLRKQSALNTLNALNGRVNDAAVQFDADVKVQCVGMYNRINERLTPMANEILSAADNLINGNRIGGFTYQNEELSPEVQCEYIDTIFPALYNAVDYVISMSAICEQGECDILIETEIEGFSQKYSQKVTLGPELTRLYIKPTLLSQELNLNSQKNTQLKISVTNLENDKIIIQETRPITLMSLYDLSLSYGSNGSHPFVNTLAWLTPEANEIKELKRYAIEEIKELTKDSVYEVQTEEGIVNVAPMTGLVGYQPGGLNLFDLQKYYVKMQALAIQCAMSDIGIAYNMSSYSSSDFSQALQRVAPPADTINYKSGVCIETSLVMASALQSAGMHCMLVFPPAHCQVAVEIWETGEYLLIETTALPITADNAASIVQYKTKEEWEQIVAESVYIIDCNMAPYLNLTPVYH